MRTRPIAMPMLLLALLAAALLAGCGGDDDSGATLGADSDPQEVLSKALGSESEAISSGVVELSFDLNATGSDGGSMSGTVEGPFESGGEEGSLPQLDLDATLSVDAQDTQIDFDGGLTITDDGVFVSYGGTDYQLDEQSFALLEASYQQSAELQQSQEDQGSLEAFGVNPADWIDDLTNEGTEDVDGTETVHVSGSANVPKMLEDLTSVAQQTGQAAEIDQAGLSEVQDSVKDASIDVYADSGDGTLRRLDVTLELTEPGTDNAATVDVSIGIADPNSDQEISAPEDAEPLENLLGQIPGGADALGGLGGLGGTSSGTGSSGGSSAGAGSGAGTGAGAEKYYDCAAQAQSAADLQDCAELLAP